MNLFVLHPDPRQAAQAHSDQHLCKMILETAQILDGGTRPIMHNLQPGKRHEIVAIPPSHRDNRVIRSAGGWEVWEYAYWLLLGLLEEYRYRYDRRHAYANSALLHAFHLRGEQARPGMSNRGFILAMPEAYKPRFTGPLGVPLAEAVVAYRAYYAAEKTTDARGRPATWRKRAPPVWLDNALRLHGATRYLSCDGRYYHYAPKSERLCHDPD